MMKAPLALLLACCAASVLGAEPAPVIVVPPAKDGRQVTVRTTPFGSGWITRTSDGRTYTTSKVGSSTVTRGPNGETMRTSPFGSGSITRTSDGRSYTTSKSGDGSVTRGGGSGSARPGATPGPVLIVPAKK